MNYDQWVSAVSNLTVIPATDTDFLAILPDCIDYVEQRTYRELDLLNTVVRDSSQAFSPNSRNFTLPTSVGIPLVTNGINVITPAGTAADSGTRNPLTPVSRDYLDLAWPSSTGATLPTSYAMLTQGTILVGPWPDAAYTVEWVGTQRPIPLSSTNPTTLLSLYFPDILIAGSMIFLSGYQKNFGGQADDPKMAVSYETQFTTLMASAAAEEFRKRLMGSSWTPLTQGPAAQPQRN